MRWPRHIFVGKNTWLITMTCFTTPKSLLAAAFLNFFVGMCYMVVGKHFMTSDFKPIVLDTITLECHDITLRSSLELAAVCFRMHTCLGTKMSRDWISSGMLCSCPNGPTWLGFSHLTSVPIIHLRTQRDVILPGKRSMRPNLYLPNKQRFQ